MLISKFCKTVVAGVAAVAFLSGCGGGGGGAKGSVSAGGTSSGVVTITVTDITGAPTSNVNSQAHANATAVVKDAAGNVLKNVLVAFATDSTYITFAPSSGTASTGSTGNSATVVMTPTAGTAGGAVMLSAVATLPDGTQLTSESVTLSVTPSTGGTGSAAVSTLTLSVTTNSGTPSLSVAAPNSLKINGVVKDGTGTVQKNVLVNFVTDPNYLVFTPSTGTASTGSTGTYATVSMTPAATTPGGAVQVTAVATLADGKTVTATPVTISVTGLPGNATSTPTLTVSLKNNLGAAASSVTVGSPLSINVSLKDGAGNPLANTVVNLSSSDPLLGVVSQASVLTNSSGIATARLDAASISAVGAAYVNADTAVGGKPVTASAPFQVGAASVAMALAIGQPSISAFGTTSVTATVTVNGGPPPSPMTVQFTSGCASTGKVTLPATVQTINGVASATYTDKGCGQTDTVVATVGAIQQTGTIIVAAPSVSNIQFVSTNPASGLLVLKGTGGQGYSETATVTFKVTDSAGAPMAQQSVIMGLTTSLGGITIDGTTGPVTKLTGQDGTVSVNVQSGTAPTSVWVTASVGSITTQSNRLIISTGRPSQDFFSLSASLLNIEGATVDGNSTVLTVHASDRLGNIVPDGTAINFITEGGQIVSNATGTSTSTCMTSGGVCSVKLVSAAYRPQNDSEPSIYNVSSNRVTVMAYTLGEESFQDTNGDNYYQSGEPFDDLGDIFLDRNESLAYEFGEQIIQYSSSNTSACINGMSIAMTTPNKLDMAASVPTTCDGVLGAAHVRRSLVIVFSGSTAAAPLANPIILASTACNTSYPLSLADSNNNPLPAGTRVEIINNMVYSGTSQETVTVYPSTVPNTSAAGPTMHTIVLSNAPSSCVGPPTGTFGVLITSPGGVQTSSQTLYNYSVQ